MNSFVNTSLGPIAIGYLPRAAKSSICRSSLGITISFCVKCLRMKSLPRLSWVYHNVELPKPPPALRGSLRVIFPCHLGSRRSLHDLTSLGDTRVILYISGALTYDLKIKL